MHQEHGRPERFLRDHANGLRQALADGAPPAIAAAVIPIRDEEVAALHQLRALLRR